MESNVKKLLNKFGLPVNPILDKNLQELINLEKVTPKTMSIYRDKVFNDINEAISILKAV